MGILDGHHSYWEKSKRRGKYIRKKSFSQQIGDPECFGEERLRDGENVNVMNAMIESKGNRTALSFLRS